MSEWQPIETAPTTLGAPRILLFWPKYAYNEGDDPEIAVVEIGWLKCNPRIDRTYWADTWEMDDYALPDFSPTHWMPLPEPPK